MISILKMTNKSDSGDVSDMIVSNILCYMTTARHSLRNDDIVRVCIAFYSCDDILKGKDLLFDIIGERSSRRRNKDRIIHELEDILKMLQKCDDESIKLPKFVCDSYCGLPPTSGFEIVASRMITLIDEISQLKDEIRDLRDNRLTDDIMRQTCTMLQEDVIIIKGELRKLNHKFMEEDVRRNSIMLLTSDKRHSVFTEGAARQDCENTSILELNIENNGCSPSAPESSREQQLIDRLIYDEGGPPTAPSYVDVCSSQLSGDIVEDNPSENPDYVVRDKYPSPLNRRTKDIQGNKSSNLEENLSNDGEEKRNNLQIGNTARTGDTREDKDGYIEVQSRQRKRTIHKQLIATSSARNTMGKKKMSSCILKSAVRSADLYIGNCALDITADILSNFIKDELGINVSHCESLETKYDDYNSFKVTLSVSDRIKLLNSDVWPSGIICRKFYSPRVRND